MMYPPHPLWLLSRFSKAHSARSGAASNQVLRIVGSTVCCEACLLRALAQSNSGVSLIGVGLSFGLTSAERFWISFIGCKLPLECAGPRHARSPGGPGVPWQRL